MATTKMGCPEVGDSVGGHGAAGGALERRSDNRQRPALDGKHGDGARVLLGAI